MKLLMLLMFYLLHAATAQMMGGLDAVDEGFLSFVVQVHAQRHRQSRPECGGSVIGERWVITAPTASGTSTTGATARSKW